jgi:hypothetical protein
MHFSAAHARRCGSEKRILMQSRKFGLRGIREFFSKFIFRYFCIDIAGAIICKYQIEAAYSGLSHQQSIKSRS